MRVCVCERVGGCVVFGVGADVGVQLVCLHLVHMRACACACVCGGGCLREVVVGGVWRRC